ncbi:MAG: FtsL-like putative cell division protein [Bacteroidales bacterium]|nr:FtsL-like putative cell division protein [Bacteroidales bacterium]
MKKTNIKAKSLIDGSFLVRRGFLGWLPVILIGVVLIIIYITNRYNIEKTVREIDKLEVEVSNLQKKHAGQKGVYQKLTQMLELERALKDRGIKVSKQEQKQVILIDVPETEPKVKNSKLIIRDK